MQQREQAKISYQLLHGNDWLLLAFQCEGKVLKGKPATQEVHIYISKTHVGGGRRSQAANDLSAKKSREQDKEEKNHSCDS
jgi:hypothetical protein